ncbi:MAG: hypothetical protein U0T69_00375 [Chitinophagales bacterium]
MAILYTKADDLNYDVIKQQRLSTLKIITLLGDYKIDSLKLYVDPSIISKQKNIIEKACIGINKYKDTAKLNSGWITVENNFYVIHSSYLLDKKYQLEIIFYFDKNSANSKVSKIKIKNFDQLESERIEKLNFQNNNPNFKPPPPIKIN